MGYAGNNTNTNDAFRAYLAASGAVQDAQSRKGQALAQGINDTIKNTLGTYDTLKSAEQKDASLAQTSQQIDEAINQNALDNEFRNKKFESIDTKESAAKIGLTNAQTQAHQINNHHVKNDPRNLINTHVGLSMQTKVEPHKKNSPSHVQKAASEAVKGMSKDGSFVPDYLKTNFKSINGGENGALNRFNVADLRK